MTLWNIAQGERDEWKQQALKVAVELHILRTAAKNARHVLHVIATSDVARADRGLQALAETAAEALEKALACDRGLRAQAETVAEALGKMFD